MYICPKCGSKIYGDASVCANCGTPLDPASRQETDFSSGSDPYGNSGYTDFRETGGYAEEWRRQEEEEQARQQQEENARRQQAENERRQKEQAEAARRQKEQAEQARQQEAERQAQEEAARRQREKAAEKEKEVRQAHSKKEKEVRQRPSESRDSGETKGSKAGKKKVTFILAACAVIVSIIACAAGGIAIVCTFWVICFFVILAAVCIRQMVENHKDAAAWKSAGLNRKREKDFHEHSYLFIVRNADFPSIRDELIRQQEPLRMHGLISADGQVRDCLNFTCGEAWTANLRLLQSDGVHSIYQFWFSYTHSTNGKLDDRKGMSARLTQIENLFAARDPQMTEQKKGMNIHKDKTFKVY